ncbi:hypothetical protein [Streptomyces mutabilis]
MVGWQDRRRRRRVGGDDPLRRGRGHHPAVLAGAGVVAASTPDAETAETAAKFRTFLHAVGAAL